MGKKPVIDWERIEADYRSGILSLREIATAHGNIVDHMSISRRAKKFGWVKDLGEKIRAKANQLVMEQAVTQTVTENKRVTDSQIIENAGQQGASIIIAHRKTIERFKALVLKLLDELDTVTDGNELFRDLGVLMRQEDDKGQDKRNDVYQKVIELTGRIDGTKKLSDTLKTLVALERENYGLNVLPKDGGQDDLANKMELARKRLANVN